MTGIDGFTTEFAVFPGRKIQRVEGRRRLETGCVHGVFSQIHIGYGATLDDQPVHTGQVRSRIESCLGRFHV